MAKQNEAANATDAQKTNDAVNKIQDQMNSEAGPLKSQANASYASKSEAVTSQAAKATSDENAQYANAVTK